MSTLSNQVFRNKNNRYSLGNAKANQLKIYDTSPTFEPTCQLHIQDEGNSCIMIECDYNDPSGTDNVLLRMEKNEHTQGLELANDTTSGDFKMLIGNQVGISNGRLLIQSAQHANGTPGFTGSVNSLADLKTSGCELKLYKSINVTDNYFLAGFERANLTGTLQTWTDVVATNAGSNPYVPSISGTNLVVEAGIYAITINYLIDNGIDNDDNVGMNFTGPAGAVIQHSQSMNKNNAQTVSATLFLTSGNHYCRFNNSTANKGNVLSTSYIEMVRLK